MFDFLFTLVLSVIVAVLCGLATRSIVNAFFCFAAIQGMSILLKAIARRLHFRRIRNWAADHEMTVLDLSNPTVFDNPGSEVWLTHDYYTLTVREADGNELELSVCVTGCWFNLIVKRISFDEPTYFVPRERLKPVRTFDTLHFPPEVPDSESNRR